MRRLLCSILGFWSAAAPAAANKSTTECIGPAQPRAYVIYLHGLTPPEQKTNEEGENRDILERLAKDLALRIALPRGPLCPTGKLCWPARDQDELLQTFDALRANARACWSGEPKYTLLGFSNGGYFAFKLYKAHQDPQLIRIMAAGSAGSWEENTDKPNPHSTFAMMIGRKDITFKKARKLADQLRKVLPGFRFETFPGTHHLDYKTLSILLNSGTAAPGRK